MTQSLAAEYDSLSKHGALKVDLPDSITNNLAERIQLRPYQIEALKRWIFYITPNSKTDISNPHLLFHMATGSGKTILMAALILDLYQRGHRNFLFFVNSSQIIEKTKDNFLNQVSAKYLFAPTIRIDGKPVELQVVENFNAVSTDAINIHFTTIQGLHTRVHHPKENTVTLEDFRDYKVVMISDEAHHLNAQTKKRLTYVETRELLSWENTVSNIFLQHPENVLLEFTATADLSHPAVMEKYHDKILYNYQLRHFREEGYSKDIELRQADLPPCDRMVQAMILSQYRLKVAENHEIHCKPVILMKSKTIRESAENESDFTSMVNNLSGSIINKLRKSSSDDETLSLAFNYIMDERGMEADEFARELQGAFGEGKVTNINRLEDLQKLQIDLNNLEAQSNDIRVIFAVNKLDEGWDVLNLFDIVRLYDTRDAGRDKVGKTTMSEAQLIGRGARYFPFNVPDQPDVAPEKRKYDSDLKHPLRILEELYYHCSHNPRYIDEIKRVLRRTGMLEDHPTRTVDLKLKKEFKESQCYQVGYVWTNKRVKNSREGVDSLSDYEIRNLYTYPTLMTGRVTEETAFDQEGRKMKQSSEEVIARDLHLGEFDQSILNFAMDSSEFFHFVNLKKHFPRLTSVSEFRTSDSYLGGVTVTVRGVRSDLESLNARQRLKIIQYVLKEIKAGVRHASVEFVGTRNFTPQKISECFTDKTVKLRIEGESSLSWGESRIKGLDLIDPVEKSWHAYDNCYGTDQEKYFIKFLDEQADSIRNQYDEFFLLRNEKAVKLFAFKSGQGFEPDYILFLRKKGKEMGKVLQLFIEPKGKHLQSNDSWKQELLEDIEWRDKVSTLFEGDEYWVYGLPFYDETGQGNAQFKKAFQQLLHDE